MEAAGKKSDARENRQICSTTLYVPLPVFLVRNDPSSIRILKLLGEQLKLSETRALHPVDSETFG
jgi:hypothetical protein